MTESPRRKPSRRIAVLPPAAAGNPAVQTSLRAPARPQLPEFGEQNLCLLQILGVEAFGEPIVDRGEKLVGVLALALALPQAGQAHRGAQLPGFRLLTSRPVERGE